MKRQLLCLCIGLATFGALLPLTGCETGEPGVTNKFGTLDAIVDGSPDKVTAAAKKACEDLKFLHVSSSATKIDGQVNAKTANDDDVEIEVHQAGDNISKMEIRVGHTGDMAVSKQILADTKKNLK